MLRALSMVFERSEKVWMARAPRRKAPAVRPQVESLGARVLPSTGPVLGVAYVNPNLDLNQLIHDYPPRYNLVPNLVNRSVELTGPAGGLIGTVTFTAQQVTTFQGTFVSDVATRFSVPGTFGAETYSASMNIGPVPISGSISIGTATLGGGWSYNISFSGMATGQAFEVHNYYYDDPANPYGSMEGTPEWEGWSIPDQQTVSFNGALVVSGSTSTLNGTVTEHDHGQWIWASDYLLRSDPRHQEGGGARADGKTLDVNLSKTVSDTLV
jgi:hypothetical protein